jgi:hypothetical protein
MVTLMTALAVVAILAITVAKEKNNMELNK